ncbi:acid phosphatase [Pseudohalioglobus lutimaris]|uniref:Acid phosphatase n=1 Tax=Pseudohalioglobus lutimaris TaxID=1737061 RepID=A0A2N5X0A7_9GAMM|nr:phosphatase PAP2 family protein [Pseudohalioglobus lutimaris]PLW67890.1 acid phosphatase [Pseudohalioglobus lutimaris]
MPHALQITFIALAASILVAGCASSGKQATFEDVPEVRPGILQGYLPMKDPLRTVEIVPPAPEAGSPRQALDDEVARRAIALRGTARWDLATKDAHLAFPGAQDAFTCATGIPISEATTPQLYMLMRRTLADVGLASYSAKNAYQRVRPFMVNGEPTCTPEEEGMLRKDGSYPSGHTSIGWGWALILAELMPEKAEAILARGRAFGESRNVCNVHWHSDVVAGRMVAASAYSQLHNNEDFLAAMEATRKELAGLDMAALSPSRDCEEEAKALSITTLGK